MIGLCRVLRIVSGWSSSSDNFQTINTHYAEGFIDWDLVPKFGWDLFDWNGRRPFSSHAAGRMPSSVAFQARKPAAISKRGIRSICTAGNCGDRNGAMIRATLDKNGQHFSHVEDCIASAADLDLVLRSAKTCKARLDR